MGGCVFSYAVLQPLIRETRGRQCPTRFFLSDIIWLMLMLQIPLAAASLVPKWRGKGDKVIFGLALVAVCVYAWSLSVAAMSALGLNAPLRRGLLLVILLPVSLFGALAPVVGIVTGIPSGVVTMAEGGTSVDYGVVAIAMAMLVTIGFTCRRLTAWVVADPTRDVESASVEELPE